MPPPGPVDGARTKADALLAEVEQVRPGLVRHRVLDLDAGPLVLSQALSECFDECDRISPDSEGHALSFADETFDLVHCGTVPRGADPARVERMVGEAVRVLRLFGVGVVEFVGGTQSGPESLPSQVTLGRLEAHVSAIEHVSLRAGRIGKLTVTVANVGATTLGSAISPPRLEGHWGSGGASVAAELRGILLPGDSTAVTLAPTVPAVAGTHRLELSLTIPDPWRARRSPVTVIELAAASGDATTLEKQTAIGSFATDAPLARALANAGGQVLKAISHNERTGALPRSRYFFARA